MVGKGNKTTYVKELVLHVTASNIPKVFYSFWFHQSVRSKTVGTCCSLCPCLFELVSEVKCGWMMWYAPSDLYFTFLPFSAFSGPYESLLDHREASLSENEVSARRNWSITSRPKRCAKLEAWVEKHNYAERLYTVYIHTCSLHKCKRRRKSLKLSLFTCVELH